MTATTNADLVTGRGTGPGVPLDPDLTALLRRLKLGKAVDTLPERLAIAKTNQMSHAEFLALALADEAARRDSTSATLRARAARLDPAMRLEAFDPDGARYDRTVWTQLTSLRVLDAARGALILGPVGVGKTHLATALGHIAVRRRAGVAFHRADQLFRTLKAARLDGTLAAEVRRLVRVDLLIIDDFALQAMDPVATADFYELVAERHHKTSTIITSNREPAEWILLMADTLLAQSAVDRLVSTSYELLVEGSPTVAGNAPAHSPRANPHDKHGEASGIINSTPRWSQGRGNPVVP